MTMKRRDALKTLGALAGSAGLASLLPGCGGGDGEEPEDDRPSRGPTTVVLMLENRSYDHVLGARALEGLGGDGLRPGMGNLDLDGNLVRPFPATRSSLCAIDPPHGWTAAHNQFNSGANDGFVTVHQRSHNSRTAIEPMQYQTRETMPVTWALADAYTTCDRYFCSVMGPTWPNRMYWHTGESNGINANDLPVQGFNWPSIHHRLDEAGVAWGYYYGNIAVPSFITDLPGVVDRCYPFTQFYDHAIAGQLPPVVYIDPAFYTNDDHPPLHPILGQQLIASIYSSLALSPQWKECTFIITYDENGGFFDHVPPPKVPDDYAAMGFDQLGFRVPTTVVGPYVKPGYVSSVQYDHTSVLKHFEKLHGLRPLTTRSTAANDLTDCFDLDRMARGEWRKPVMLPEIKLEDWPMSAACQPNLTVASATSSLTSAHDHPVLQAADARPDLFGSTDRRGHEPALLAKIEAQLKADTAELARWLGAPAIGHG